VRFERYVDDAVIHCVSRAPSLPSAAAFADRIVESGGRLHPDKTKVVVLQDGRRA